VEFALCLPLLLVVFAGIVDFGFVFQRYEVITNAAREGARMASLPAYQADPDAVVARVRSYVADGLSMNSTTLDAVLPASQVVVDIDDPIAVTGAGGTTTQVNATSVTVQYNHSFVLLQPILGLINKNWGSSITLQARSQMRHEQQIVNP
jgi:Flp pilus assembly protein TadG